MPSEDQRLEFARLKAARQTDNQAAKQGLKRSSRNQTLGAYAEDDPVAHFSDAIDAGENVLRPETTVGKLFERPKAVCASAEPGGGTNVLKVTGPGKKGRVKVSLKTAGTIGFTKPPLSPGRNRGTKMEPAKTQPARKRVKH